MKTPEELLGEYLRKSGITSKQYITEEATPHFLAGYYAGFTNAGAEALRALEIYQTGRKAPETLPMKISKLSEHIGHGTHMFHVSVPDEILNENVGSLWLVAANNEDEACKTAVLAALSLPPTTIVDQDLIEECRAYEIGEIEP